MNLGPHRLSKAGDAARIVRAARRAARTGLPFNPSVGCDKSRPEVLICVSGQGAVRPKLSVLRDQGTGVILSADAAAA